MGIEYTNRRRQTYFLHEGRTRSGKHRCFFSLKTPRKPVTKMPAGFGIYENPDGLVFLRRIERPMITNKELTALKTALTQLAATKDWTTDRKGKYVTIYAPMPRRSPGPSAAEAPADDAAQAAVDLDYAPMFRLTLADPAKHQFVLERWCLRECVNGWYKLDRGQLDLLLRTYAPHMADASFFEMM